MPRNSAQRAQPSAYRHLSEATAAELSKRAARIKATLHKSLVEVGHELTEAKRLLNHGGFVKWVERETGISARTAQLIMSAYRLCLKNENFSHLGRSALFILGAADVPPATVTAISKMIEAGSVPSYSDVRTLVRAAQLARPSPVSLAVAIGRDDPAKAQVIDFAVHKTLAKVNASLAAAGPTSEGLQEFRDRIDVCEIAVWLNAVLDDRQVFKLATMLRNADATLDALADALDAI